MSTTTEYRNYFETYAKEWVTDAYQSQLGINSIGSIRANLALNLIDDISKKQGKEKLNICDLGCGNGYFSSLLADKGHMVTAIDQSKNMINLAKEKYSNIKNINFITHPIEHLDTLALPKFDVITALGVIYYLPGDDPIFNFALKQLTKNGCFISTFRNKLFNVFHNSSKNQDLIKDEKILVEYMREIFQLKNTIQEYQIDNFVKNIYEKNIIDKNINSSKKEGIKENNKSFPKDIIEGRQHFLSEIVALAEKYNMFIEKTLTFQPHFLSASHADEESFMKAKVLADCMISFNESPISLMWSSHFMTLIRNK